MNAPELEAIIKFGQIGIRTLATRVLTFVGFIACAAAFGVALWLPTWERATIASLFALLVYWPLIRLETRKSTPPEAP